MRAILYHRYYRPITGIGNGETSRERGEHHCKSISDVRAAPLFSLQLSHVVAVFDVFRLTLASTVVNRSCGRLEGTERATLACQARVTVGGDVCE